MNIVRLEKVDIKDIAFDDRAREDYGDIEGLMEDIKVNGLIQPIAVYDSLAPWLKGNPKYEGKSFTLIAGGRRMLACLKAKMKDIPVRIYTGEITKHGLKILELAENLHRKNFTWDEEVELKKRIHELHIGMYGEKKPGATKGKSPEDVGWSQRDTANYLNESSGGTSQDLMLANAMEKIPVLKKAKSKKEAVLMLNKIEEDIITAELQKRLEKGEVEVFDRKEEKEQLLKSFIITDAMKQFKEDNLQGLADIVICDPPYAIDLASVKHEDQTVDIKVKNADEYKEFMRPIIQGCYDIMKDEAWLILWFGVQWISEVKELCKEVGFDLGPVPFGFWTKNNGRTLFPDRYLASRIDMFMYMRKGEATIEKTGHNVFQYPAVSSTRFHKTEKPVALEKDILYTFARAGQLLIVPFLGSGNSLIAAHQLGMQCFGFEIEPKFKSRFMYNLYGAGILDIDSNSSEYKKLEKEVSDEDETTEE